MPTSWTSSRTPRLRLDADTKRIRHPNASEGRPDTSIADPIDGYFDGAIAEDTGLCYRSSVVGRSNPWVELVHVQVESGYRVRSFLTGGQHIPVGRPGGRALRSVK